MAIIKFIKQYIISVRKEAYDVTVVLQLTSGNSRITVKNIDAVKF